MILTGTKGKAPSFRVSFGIFNWKNETFPSDPLFPFTLRYRFWHTVQRGAKKKIAPLILFASQSKQTIWCNRQTYASVGNACKKNLFTYRLRNIYFPLLIALHFFYFQFGKLVETPRHPLVQHFLPVCFGVIRLVSGFCLVLKETFNLKKFS